MDDFAFAVQDAPEKRLLSAVTYLRNAGSSLSEIRCLAFALEERRAFPASFTLMKSILEEGGGQDLDLAARTAVLLNAWKGEKTAGAFLNDRQKTPLPVEQAAILYRYGFFEKILDRLADVSVYPRKQREQARLIYLSAWLSSGRTPDSLDEGFKQHYRGSWLQRKMARVTGYISSDPDHLAGRYLLGMIFRTELLERIDSPQLRCQYPYIVGLSKRAKGGFTDAAAWYQLSRESLQENCDEFGWATNEMFWWAHLGTRNRNRRLSADITAYTQTLIERTER